MAENTSSAVGWEPALPSATRVGTWEARSQAVLIGWPYSQPASFINAHLGGLYLKKLSFVTAIVVSFLLLFGGEAGKIEPVVVHSCGQYYLSMMCVLKFTSFH